MKNELLKIGPYTVYGYGVMIALAIVTAYFTTEIRAKRLRLERERVFPLVVCCALGGLLGAKLLFLITEWKTIAADPSEFLNVLAEGFVVYGGIIGGILAGYFYCRFAGLKFLVYFDLAMPSIAIAQCIGRIGCLLAGCCYGKETEHFPSITFHTSEFAPNGVPLIPTQIYASLLNLLHFLLLLLIARHKKKDGQVAAAYLIFYSIGRFALEFLRGDKGRGAVGLLSTSQFISIFILAAGLLLLLMTGRREARSAA